MSKSNIRTRADQEVENDSSDRHRGDNNQPRKKRKQNYRHSREQIQTLKAFFKENTDPDLELRQELSRNLGLDIKRVNSWFYKQRDQMRGKILQLENSFLRNDNDRLRNENEIMWGKIKKSVCKYCVNQLQGKIHRLQSEIGQIVDDPSSS